MTYYCIQIESEHVFLIIEVQKFGIHGFKFFSIGLRVFMELSVGVRNSFSQPTFHAYTVGG